MSGRAIIIGAFLMALAGTGLAIMLFGNPSDAANAQVRIVTVEVLITSTPDPNATIPVIIITATPDRTQVAVPDTVAQAANQTPVTGPTLNATALAANPAGDASSQLNLPQNCILHTIAAGDTPFGIAQQYGANGFTIMQVNNLDDVAATRLQIGDVLIVPLEGCPLDQLPNYRPQSQIVSAAVTTPQATAGAEATEEPPAGTPAPNATITLAPTAANAQVIIGSISRAGDITAEGITIRNTGATVNLTGWTLRDAEGNTYTFREFILFSNAEVTVFTRAGQNTPIALYWGRDTAVWGDAGDVAILSDARGNVQASARVSALIELGN
jgi:LysM repeat protein